MFLVPGQFRVDIFEEIRDIIEGDIVFVITHSVKKELEKISKSKSKDSTASKLALSFIKRKNLQVIEGNGRNTDEEIVNLADENTIVATNDKLLQKKLKEKKIKVIYLRSKSMLDLY